MTYIPTLSRAVKGRKTAAICASHYAAVGLFEFENYMIFLKRKPVSFMKTMLDNTGHVGAAVLVQVTRSIGLHTIATCNK